MRCRRMADENAKVRGMDQLMTQSARTVRKAPISKAILGGVEQTSQDGVPMPNFPRPVSHMLETGHSTHAALRERQMVPPRSRRA